MKSYFQEKEISLFLIIQERSYSSEIFLEISFFWNIWKKKIWFFVQCLLYICMNCNSFIFTQNAKIVKKITFPDSTRKIMFQLIFFEKTIFLYYIKIRIFVLRKFVKRTEKIIFSLVFVCFRFTKIYFLNFPSNENVRKQNLSANAYSCVNMKFSQTRAVCKYETLYRFVTETSNFSPAFRSTFR